MFKENLLNPVKKIILVKGITRTTRGKKPEGVSDRIGRKGLLSSGKGWEESRGLNVSRRRKKERVLLQKGGGLKGRRLYVERGKISPKTS